MKESVFKDLVYKLEGYGEAPEYQIESITRFKGGLIGIVIRERQEEAKPEAAATERTQDGGQTEQEAAE